MALTYGFFNSVNHDRKYDAIQFGQIFDGIITDGVYGTYLKGMMVIASDNANEVIIQPGRAWFNHTWSYNDANLPFAAPEPEVLLDRVDTLVLDVNLEQAERQNKYLWVQGEPSSQNPQAPSLIRSVTHNQYPLCDVYRKAGTTMIYTADITNRVGTSDTPFVTGVLEGIDLDAWINQWDAEFHTWENATKISFEAWMLTQQETYTAWFDALKDQMEDDLAEFEAWFETIKDIIDSSAATHLQAEIDALKLMLPAGSHITITTQNSELFGRNVTITDGEHPATSKFDISGVAEIETYPYVGNLTISSTDGIRTASATVNIPYFGRYSFEIAFWAAVVNINGGSELAGYQVTIKNSSDAVVATVVLDGNGRGVWTAIEPDTYKFSVTYGGETMEVSLNVTQETTYTVEIHGGFNYNGWLNAGDVSGTYASLDEVLADEKAVRKLMTKHASVDYLANSTVNEDVEKIIKNDLVAKWTTRRAYALDTLSANADIKAVMDRSEVKLVGAVPKMTSDTTPYGVASAKSYYGSSNPVWHAFDGDESTGWDSANGDYTNVWLRYQFVSPKCVKKVKIHNRHYATNNPTYTYNNYKIQASNDASTWVDLYVGANTNKDEFIEVDIDNDNSYTYYQLLLIDQYGANAFFGINSLQFYAEEFSSKYDYGEWALVGQVPKMTSNSAPYGEASASSVFTGGYEAYKAFCESSGWSSAAESNPWLSYKFVTPTIVKEVRFTNYYLSGYEITSFKIQAYGSNGWEDLTDAISPSIGEKVRVPLDNDIAYQQYRIYILSMGSGGRTNIANAQFYAYAPKGNVPVMTSNTAPYGEASADSAYSSSYSAYRAFDGDYSTEWASNVSGSSASGQKLYYKFANPVCIKRAYFDITCTPSPTRYTSLYVIGSNDGVNWTRLGEFSQPLSVQNTLELENDNYYLYYGIEFATANDRATATILQFYGRELSESVPKMTSDTTPYGEVFASSFESPNYEWNAFDKDSSSNWSANTLNNDEYIGYEFEIPVRVLFFEMNSTVVAGGGTVSERTYELQAYDGSDWITVKAFSMTLTAGSKTWYRSQVEVDGAYKKYRIIQKSATTAATRFVAYIINFYGFNYGQYDWDTDHPRHYIYDSGLELEELEALTTANGWTPYSGYSFSENSKKEPNKLSVGPSSSNKEDGFGNKSGIDFTDYNLVRFVADPTSYDTVASLTFNISSGKSLNTGRLANLSFKDNREGSIDVSSINQTAYIEPHSDNSATRYGCIYELWLE